MDANAQYAESHNIMHLLENMTGVVLHGKPAEPLTALVEWLEGHRDTACTKRTVEAEHAKN